MRGITGRGPLAGLRVLEVGGIGPVEFAGMLLADLGADIVRIERPDGQVVPDRAIPDSRPDILGRGRTRLTADLKPVEALDTVMEMVRCADVLIEGSRPGVMERLGLGPEVTQPANPRLFTRGSRAGGSRGRYPAARATTSILSLSPACSTRSAARAGHRRFHTT